MAITFNDDTGKQGLVQHLKFLTGQDSLDIKDATRLINFAADDYSYIALTSDGLWQFDDTRNVAAPTASSTLAANATEVTLNTGWLMINGITVDGTETTDYTYTSNKLVFPTSSKARAIVVTFSRPVDYFTAADTTAAAGIPRIHQEYLALHAAYRLSLRTNDSNRAELRNELGVFEDRIRDFYSKRDKTQSRLLVAKNAMPNE
jgi:hypothetical protein